MKKAETAVKELVKKWGSTDPFELCRLLGIRLFFSDLPDVTDGVYFRLQDYRIILINQNISPDAARVAAAHELGHAVLHPDTNYAFMTDATLLLPQKLERQAEEFCAELLLYGTADELGDFDEITPATLAAVKNIPENLAGLWLDNHFSFGEFC